jgi:hypothetical protein
MSRKGYGRVIGSTLVRELTRAGLADIPQSLCQGDLRMSSETCETSGATSGQVDAVERQ